jgi:hypothetical protein
MNGTLRLLAVALAAVAFLSVDLQAQSTAAAELNLGVGAFKKSAYAEAIQHLEMIGKVTLGTTCWSRVRLANRLRSLFLLLDLCPLCPLKCRDLRSSCC